MTERPVPTATEKAVVAGTLAMAAGAFFGHLLAPERVAAHFGWTADRWYQREIGAFNLGLGVGVAELLVGRPERAFLTSSGVSALALAATRAAALRSGDRSGLANVVTVIEDAALGLGALWIARTRLGPGAFAPSSTSGTCG